MMIILIIKIGGWAAGLSPRLAARLTAELRAPELLVDVPIRTYHFNHIYCHIIPVRGFISNDIWSKVRLPARLGAPGLAGEHAAGLRPPRRLGGRLQADLSAVAEDRGKQNNEIHMNNT